jgi:ABC-type xylose transport system substrate-binding protein/maltose-binding protein MalE
MRDRRILFIILILGLLAACGSSTPVPTSVPLSGTPEVPPAEPAATSAARTEHATPTRTRPASDYLKIVFLLSAIDSPRQELFEQLLTDNTRGLTGTVRVETADNDADTQRIQVEAALAEGAPVLVIQPVDPDAAGMYVDAAHKAGAKVIAFERLINTRDLDAYVSHDLAQMGRMQAQAAVNWLTLQKTRKPWNFIFLEGPAGDPLAAEITRGYRQVLDPLIAKNEVKIVADRAIGDWSEAQSLTAAQEELTKAKNNVQAVLTNNSALARGALSALETQKLGGKVFVAGAGADPENLNAICSSTQNLDLARDDAQLARSAARLAVALADERTPVESGFTPNTIRVDDRDVFHVAVPVQAITLDSIQAALVQTGKVRASQLGSCFPPLAAGAVPPQVSARDTLTVWVQEDPASPTYAYLANLAAAFRAANPGVEVHLQPKDAQTVRETFADASDGVDLLWTSNEEVQQFAASDLLRDNRFISPTLFIEPAVAAGTREGGLYGVPARSGNNLVVYYNKKLLREPPQTTDALLRLGPTLTRESSGQYTLVYDTTNPFWLMPWLAAYGGSPLGPDGRTPTLDTRAMTETLTLLASLREKKVALPDADHIIADALFTDGRAAMIIAGDEALDGYAARFGADLGVTKMPQVNNNAVPRPYSGGMYFALPAGVSGSKLELAQAFIQFVTSKAIQVDMAKRFRQLPALKEALNDAAVTGDPVLKGLSDQMQVGLPPPDSPILTCIWEAIRPNQIAAISGATPPADAARAMQAAADACIENLP